MPAERMFNGPRMAAIIWNLLLWRDIKTSVAALLSAMFLLTALSLYSFLTVATCITIPLLTTTLVLRALWAAKCSVLKSPMEHPFQGWLEDKWTLEDGKIASYNQKVSKFINDALLKIKEIILVADMVDSIKSLLLLFILNYIGKCVSGITLLFICIVVAFTIPKLYEVYRAEIDKIFDGLRSKYNEFLASLRAKIPIGRTNNNVTKANNKDS